MRADPRSDADPYYEESLTRRRHWCIWVPASQDEHELKKQCQILANFLGLTRGFSMEMTFSALDSALNRWSGRVTIEPRKREIALPIAGVEDQEVVTPQGDETLPRSGSVVTNLPKGRHGLSSAEASQARAWHELEFSLT